MPVMDVSSLAAALAFFGRCPFGVGVYIEDEWVMGAMGDAVAFECTG